MDKFDCEQPADRPIAMRAMRIFVYALGVLFVIGFTKGVYDWMVGIYDWLIAANWI